MKRLFVLALLCIGLLGFVGCDQSDTPNPSADDVQSNQTEKLTTQATNKVGMPGILNFREREELKMIFEMRDRATVTYSYLYNNMTGKLVFLCNSIAYPIPYATEFTNPQYIAKENDYQSGSFAILPQADPNSLFPPSSAAGTWVMCQDPNNANVIKPVYAEPDVIASPFPLQGNTGQNQ